MLLAERIFKVLLIFFILWGLGGTAMGAQGGEGGGTDSSFDILNPLKCGNDPNVQPLQDCVDKVLNGLIVLSAPIVAVMVMVGGFQILSAGGDPEKFSTGRRTILYAAVGFAVILLAKGVVLIIESIVGGGTCPGGVCNNGGS
ncbi:MAG: hypothetical protein HY093_02785 [Candidatus Liptonbacteria bacterium]|nr:hypothetical protein [Candidatus Liptonbacteria bacterium]